MSYLASSVTHKDHHPRRVLRPVLGLGAAPVLLAPAAAGLHLRGAADPRLGAGAAAAAPRHQARLHAGEL